MAAFALSCSEEGSGVAVTVDIDPKELIAPNTMSSQSLNVISNGSWTLSVTSETGDPISWAVPNKTSGNGDTKVSVMVYANKYSNDRKAMFKVTSSSGVTAQAVLTQSGDNNSNVDDSQIEVRVGTYNLRMSTLDSKDNDNKWSVRKPRLMKSIEDCDFDVFGVNEVDDQIQKDLNTEFGHIYTCRFFSPYSQTGVGNKAQGILYKTDEFTLSDWNFFWPSNNPHDMSTNDTGGNGSFSRGGCCAILTHKGTGIKFFLMVTHGFLNAEPRETFAYVYEDMEKKFNTKGYPSLFVGDMNASPTSAPARKYKEYWKDVYENLTTDKREGAIGTFNGFNLNVNLATASRIDHIYYRGQITPLSYMCLDKKYDGFWPSDHLPVYSDMIIKSTVE